MVKIFQGDCHTVESEINTWIDVYRPVIHDVKQSIIYLEKEHGILLIMTVFFESKSETEKVRYQLHKRKQ